MAATLAQCPNLFTDNGILFPAVQIHDLVMLLHFPFWGFIFPFKVWSLQGCHRGEPHMQGLTDTCQKYIEKY